MDAHQTSFRESGRLERAIQAFAQRLKRGYEVDLRRLSGTGVQLARADRIPQRVQECRVESERVRHWRGTGDDRGDAGDDADETRIVPDVTFLEEWLNSEPRPLLVTAPFGAGKSVLMAEFACRLAEALLAKSSFDPVSDASLLIPWPVRLRDWIDHPSLPFRDFVLDAAHELTLEGTGLTSEDCRQLLEHNRLLFLFDGFDELAGKMGSDGAGSGELKKSTVLENISQLECERYLLTSRPDHGAEAGFESDQIHTLRELTPEEIRNFIIRQTEMLPKSFLSGRYPMGHGEAVIRAYEKAQPHIQNTLSRPLFLLAWYSQMSQNPLTPLETINDLMTIVYLQVLEQREGQLGLKGKEALDARQVFGALMMPFAERGFESPILGSKLLEELSAILVLQGSGGFEKWLELAVVAGFVTKVEKSYYAMKVPVTEFLLGYYLAWQGGTKPEDSKDHAGQQPFIEAFQQWFWWRDFDDIWLYAFDSLWNGTSSARSLAKGVVKWLLNYSKSSLETANWTGSLDPQLKTVDQEPFHCDGLVLRVLLPIGKVPKESKAEIVNLVREALNRLVETEVFRVSSGLSYDFSNLEETAPFRRAEIHCRVLHLLENSEDPMVCGAGASLVSELSDGMNSNITSKLVPTLTKRLGDRAYKVAWGRIGAALEALAVQLDPVEAQVQFLTLENWLRDRTYQFNWRPIRSALEALAVRLDPVEAKVNFSALMNCLIDPAYAQAWWWTITARRALASRLEPTEAKEQFLSLMNWFCKPTYRDTWWQIEDVLIVLASELELDEAKASFLTLVNYVLDPACKEACKHIAPVLEALVSRLDSAEVKEYFLMLMNYLGELDYNDAWEWIAAVLRALAGRLDPANVTEHSLTLMNCLRDPAYEDAWKWIAYVLRALVMRLDPAQVKETFSILTNCLRDTACMEAQWPIASVLEALARRLEPAEAQAHFSTLMDCLSRPVYKEAWEWIASALTALAARLESAEVQAHFLTLMDCLPQPAYKAAWGAIVSALEELARRLDSAEVKEYFSMLMNSLRDSDCKETQIPIATALKALAPRLEPAEAKAVFLTLMNCFRKPTYREVWPHIGHVLEVLIAWLESYEAKAHFLTLMNYLHEPTDKDARVWIASVLRALVAGCDSKDAGVLIRKVFEEPQTISWFLQEHNSVLVALVSQADCDGARLVVQLMEPMLLSWTPKNDNRASVHAVLQAAAGRLERDEALELADSWARAGRRSDALGVIEHFPGLVWYVREIVGERNNTRIVYGVCERYGDDFKANEEVRFDAKGEYAPPSIKSILASRDHLLVALSPDDQRQGVKNQIASAMKRARSFKGGLTPRLALVREAFKKLEDRYKGTDKVIDGWSKFKDMVDKWVRNESGWDEEEIEYIRGMDLGNFTKACNDADCEQWWSGKGKKKSHRSLTDWKGFRKDET